MPNGLVENRTVRDVPELIADVLEVAKRENPPVLWFRGLGCSEFNLLPTLLRSEKSLDSVLERERRLVERFRQRSLPYWRDGYPQSPWEHLFAMQHHGLPTRLMDWSENLLVATYFAAQAPVGHASRDKHACHPKIAVIDPVAWNRVVLVEDTVEHVLTTADDELKRYAPALPDLQRLKRSPVTLYGTHNSGRIVAQRGTFMVWGRELKPLEEFSFAEHSGPLIRMYTIEASSEELAEQLTRLGFAETMVFPELPALARELDRVEGWRE